MSASLDLIKTRVKPFVPLSPMTTFHIGGPAEMFVEVETEDELAKAVVFAHQEKIPFLLLGGGSNLVVSDRGVSGLVIRNKASDRKLVDPEKGFMTFSSGIPLWDLVETAQKNGLTGLESFAGIPGTLGGAIYGNAGAYGKSIGDVLVGAEIMTFDGRICQMNNNFFDFSYRSSILKKAPFLVLNATFKLAKGDPQEIKAQMDDILAQRKAKHPPEEVGSAGSFFKNLDPKPGEKRRQAAGELLDQAGAKSLSVGGASVYPKHANFIVNYGKATADDVKSLAALMKQKVIEKFGITLHEEVIYWGN